MCQQEGRKDQEDKRDETVAAPTLVFWVRMLVPPLSCVTCSDSKIKIIGGWNEIMSGNIFDRKRTPNKC